MLDVGRPIFNHNRTSDGVHFSNISGAALERYFKRIISGVFHTQ